MYGKRLKIHRSQMTLLVSPLFLFRVVTDSRLFFPPPNKQARFSASHVRK